MIGNWAKATTTTASGATDVAGLTAVTGFPTIADMIFLNAYCWYVILDSTDKPLEAGVGRRTSATNISRLKVSKTYSAGVYDDTDPTALTLVTSTTYNVIISPIDASMDGAMPGVSTTYQRKGLLSAHELSGTTTLAVVDDRQWFVPFKLVVGAVIKGFLFEVSTAAANTFCQAGLYSLDHNGEPTTLLGRSVDQDTSTTGQKIPACATNFWASPGWYAISLMSKDGVAALAPTVRAKTTSTAVATPFGISAGTPTETMMGLRKDAAGWANLADVDLTTGATALGAASGLPLVGVLFE